MKLNNILLVILIITLPLTIILTSVRFVIFNKSYYHKQFAEHNVYREIPNANEVLDNITAYFKGKQRLNINIFTKNELAHLKDVRIIINIFLIIYYMLLILDGILFCYIIRKTKAKNIPKIFLSGGSIIILLSLLLYLLKNSFSNLFIKFHLIFFPQGNWQFPVSSNLIKLFPEAFFYDTFYIIILISFIISLLLISSAIFLVVLNKEKK